MQKDNQISEVGTKDISEETALSFVSDSRLLFLFKRVSKITRAICLVTGHIDSTSDIKARIQKDALDLTDLVYGLSYSTTSDITKVKAVLFSTIMSLTSKIGILQSLQKVSDSNATILVNQINIFLHEVEDFFNMSDMFASNLSLDLFEVDSEGQEADTVGNMGHNFLRTPVSRGTPVEHSESHVARGVPPVVEKTRAHDKVVQSSFHPTNTEFRQKLSLAKSIDQLHGTNENQLKKTDFAQTSKGTQGRATSTQAGISIKNESKNDRQQLIINTISTKGDLSIKDLSGVIKGCSEKTIQRELISLVDRGILSKTGERRWSRYSLA